MNRKDLYNGFNEVDDDILERSETASKSNPVFQTQEERPRNDLRALYDVSLSECLGGRQLHAAGT